jgi:hypothetical protein
VSTLSFDIIALNASLYTLDIMDDDVCVDSVDSLCSLSHVLIVDGGTGVGSLGSLYTLEVELRKGLGLRFIKLSIAVFDALRNDAYWRGGPVGFGGVKMSIGVEWEEREEWEEGASGLGSFKSTANGVDDITGIGPGWL